MERLDLTRSLGFLIRYTNCVLNDDHAALPLSFRPRKGMKTIIDAIKTDLGSFGDGLTREPFMYEQSMARGLERVLAHLSRLVPNCPHTSAQIPSKDELHLMPKRLFSSDAPQELALLYGKVAVAMALVTPDLNTKTAWLQDAYRLFHGHCTKEDGDKPGSVKLVPHHKVNLTASDLKKLTKGLRWHVEAVKTVPGFQRLDAIEGLQFMTAVTSIERLPTV